MKKIETLETLERNQKMINEILFECPDSVKFTKVIDCSKNPTFDALLLIKINDEKTKVLKFYTTDHVVSEDEYYEKLVEYLKNNTVNLHKIVTE